MAWIRACGGGSPAVPDGKTVTPINDVTIWQQCAGIANPTYTTLVEILADTGILQTLMASNNAVDYLVRSKEFITNPLVPTMTSDTTPSGECFADSVYANYDAYLAFDGDDVTSFIANYGAAQSYGTYVGYEFTTNVCAKKAVVKFYETQNATSNFHYKFQGYVNDEWVDLLAEQTINLAKNTLQTYEHNLNNNSNIKKYRLICDKTHVSGGVHLTQIRTVQFYAENICDNSNAMQYIGANNYCADTLLNDADWLHAIFESSYKDSVLNAQIPTMTSNNQPSGVASSTSDYSSSTTAFRAFDKTSNGWLSVKSQSPSYVKYAFPNNIVPKVVTMKAGAYSAGSAISDKLQMSADDSTYTDIKICSVTATGQTFTQEMPANTDEYRYFRVYCQNGQYASNGDLVYIEEFMVYGRQDV